MFREVVPVRERRVFFLETAGIGQDDLAEILRPLRTEHAAAEALRDQPRQVAAMIEMRVREDDRLDAGSRNRQILPVPLAHLLQPLEQPGIDHDSRAVRLSEALRTL